MPGGNASAPGLVWPEPSRFHPAHAGRWLRWVAPSKRSSSSVTTPNTCSGGACLATTSATRRSADCSAASCSTFARDSRFEIAVETSSANRATRSSLPGGNASARRAPTTIAPQRRPSTTIGPRNSGARPLLAQDCPDRTLHLGEVVEPGRATGPKQLVDDASFRNRKIGACRHPAVGDAECGQDSGGAVRFEPNRTSDVDVQEAAELRCDESEYLLAGACAATSSATRPSAACSAARRSNSPSSPSRCAEAETRMPMSPQSKVSSTNARSTASVTCSRLATGCASSRTTSSPIRHACSISSAVMPWLRRVAPDCRKCRSADSASACGSPTASSRLRVFVNVTDSSASGGSLAYEAQ